MPDKNSSRSRQLTCLQTPHLFIAYVFFSLRKYKKIKLSRKRESDSVVKVGCVGEVVDKILEWTVRPELR